MTSFNTLQARIDALNAENGGTIRLSAGTTQFSDVADYVDLKAGVKIIGAGREKTILKLDDSSTAASVLRVSGDDTAIESLTLDGNESGGAIGSGIYLANPYNRFTIRNVAIKNIYGSGVHFSIAEGPMEGWYIQDLIMENIGVRGFGCFGNSTNTQTAPIGAISGLHILSYAQRLTPYTAMDLSWPWLMDSVYIYGTSGCGTVDFDTRASYSCLTNYLIKKNGASNISGTGLATCEVNHGNQIS